MKKTFNTDTQIEELDDTSKLAKGSWDFVGYTDLGEDVIKDVEGYKVICSRGSWIKLVLIDKDEVIFDEIAFSEDTY